MPPLGMSQEVKNQLAKLDCYFFHMQGHCKYGDSCFQKHSPISAAKKAALKHPAEAAAEAKAKRVAAPAVEKTGAEARGRSKGAGRGAGGGTGDKACTVCGKTGHVRADCELKDVKCKNCGKTGHIAKLCRAPGGGGVKGGQPSRPNSPAPSHGSNKVEGKTNAELKKDLRLPGFCKDFEAGACKRELVPGMNPKRCARGCHCTSEVYAQLKAKYKTDMKTAKDKRNRSQSAPPARKP